MKTSSCGCGQGATLFFDSVRCTLCGRMAGFCPDRLLLASFDAHSAPDLWQAVTPAAGIYRQCENTRAHQVCNWMVPAGDPNAYCRACRLNAVIPDLGPPQNKVYWAKLEAAKRRALYTLLALGLSIASKDEDPAHGLQFRFMSDKESGSEFTLPLWGQEPVYTGHNRGEITINLAEADDIALTRARIVLGEHYRTLLGHFRHELGHYFWYMFIGPDQERLAQFRDLFGDEQQDYRQALARYYGGGARQEAGPDFISAYAAVHPWEDWAETCAHYLHMIDTLETAGDFGVRLQGWQIPAAPLPQALPPGDGADIDASTLLRDWTRLAVGMNALNRSMGLQDAYPFVLTDTVRRKLQYVHEVVMEERRGKVA